MDEARCGRYVGVSRMSRVFRQVTMLKRTSLSVLAREHGSMVGKVNLVGL